MGCIRLAAAIAGVLAAATLARPASAQAVSPQRSPLGSAARQAVSDERLAELRGGFDLPGSGLQLSIGVQRQVQVDGSSVPVSTFQFCSPSCAAVTAGAVGSLIQRGSANSVPGATLGTPAGAVVIQNSLDHQQIKASTTLDVTANSLQLLKGSAWQSAVGGAIGASTRR